MGGACGIRELHRDEKAKYHEWSLAELPSEICLCDEDKLIFRNNKEAKVVVPIDENGTLKEVELQNVLSLPFPNIIALTH